MARFRNSKLLQQNLAIRYLLVAAGFLTLILLMFSLTQIYREYQQDTRDLETKSSIQSNFLASVSVEHILTNNFFVLERLVRQIHTDPDVVYAVIMDVNGKALTRFIDPDSPTITAEQKAESPDLLTLLNVVRNMPLVHEQIEPIQLEGSTVGTVRLGYTEQGVLDRLINSAMTTLLTTLVVIGLLCLLTFVVFRWIIGHRLQTVGIAADRFAQGDFSHRVPVTVSDEIGRLSVAFNHMADQLEETLAGLQDANREVEAANQALRISEAEARKLSQVASRTSNLAVISTASGEIEWVNDAFCRTTGYTLPELVGKRPGGLLQGPETDPAAVEYMSDRLKRQLPFNCEVVNYARDGTPYWVGIDCQPVYDDDGSVINFIAVETDITQQKQSEQALRERIQLVSMISTVSAEFISCPAAEIDGKIDVVIERVGRQLDVDYVSIELFEPEDEEAISALSTWAADHLRPYLAAVELSKVDRQSAWSRVLDRGQPVVAPQISALETPATIVSRLRGAAFQSLLLLPIDWSGQRKGQLLVGTTGTEKDWGNDLVSAMEVVTDIFASALQRKEFDSALETERLILRQRTDDLRIANVALAEASLAKDAFWANMSHELRTPLNAILGYTQIMRRDRTLSEQQAEHVSVIDKSGNHLLDLINNVLSLSKAEAGRMTLAPMDFDLLDLLNTLDDMFRPRMEKKQLAFTIVHESELPRYIRADGGKLRQVLLNLLENALKFTDEGSVTLRVKHNATTSQLCIGVEDTGVGIAANELDQLFEQFGQTASGRQSGTGTGLGLALSQQFIGMMGGDIQVVSQVGAGSTFSFKIDIEIKDGQAGSEDEVKDERRILGLAEGQPAFRVLVAEDLKTNQDLLKDILKDTGFVVRFADNGLQALTIADEWPPDVVLMDLRMPIMDGYESTSRFRSDPRFIDLPIIAVTASALDHQQHLAFTAGCTDVVYKPIQIDALLRTMARHIDAEFQYEDRPHTAEAASAASQPVTHLSFEQLPADLRQRLHEAASLLDADALVALSHEVADHDVAVAKTIRTMIADFEFEAIIEAGAVDERADVHD